MGTVSKISNMAAASGLEAMGGEAKTIKKQAYQNDLDHKLAQKPESRMNVQLSSDGLGDYLTDEDLVEVMADDMEAHKLNSAADIENLLDEKQSAIVQKMKQRQADDSFVEDSVTFIQTQINEKKEDDARREQMYEE